MRVLQVTAIPITALRFVEPLMQSLRQLGNEVELACGPGRGLEVLEAAGFTIHRVPISRNLLSWRNLHAVGAMRALMRRGGFDIVHVHTPVAAAVGRAAARRVGSRIFYTMHGSAWGRGSSARSRALFTLVERHHGRRTDMVFTVNAEDAEDCVRLARVPESRVRVLPAGGAGVAQDFILDDDRVKQLRHETRVELGIQPDAQVVVYVGRTAAAKGLGVLAHAFGRIIGQEPTAHLIIVGEALEGERDAYSRERFLAEVGYPASSRVSWLGFRDHVAQYVAAADIAVLLSDREGFGMSLAEAAAVGRPAVATDTRGARTVVEPDATGYLVPLRDPEAAAERLLFLLRDPQLTAKMGAAARDRARSRFTREAVISANVDAYKAVELRAREGVSA